MGGFLYTFVSMKDLPDGTFPGILRELMVLDFPVVVNAEVTIPDQTKVISGFKSRMKKMQAAQIDSRGGRMINVDAAVAHSQLNDVLTAVISSSLKGLRVFVGRHHPNFQTGREPFGSGRGSKGAQPPPGTGDPRRGANEWRPRHP